MDRLGQSLYARSRDLFGRCWLGWLGWFGFVLLINRRWLGWLGFWLGWFRLFRGFLYRPNLCGFMGRGVPQAGRTGPSTVAADPGGPARCRASIAIHKENLQRGQGGSTQRARTGTDIAER